MTDQSKVIHWINNKQSKKLATVNIDNQTYDFWSPYTSKIAAAISNGLEIFPFFKQAKILYIDSNHDENLNHLVNMVGNDGKIYLEKIKFSLSSKTISQNLEDIGDMTKQKIDNVDIFYIDSPNKNYYKIIQKYEVFLKKNGFLILIANNENIITNTSNNDMLDFYHHLKSKYEILQQVFLDEFFKKQTLIIAQFIDKN